MPFTPFHLGPGAAFKAVGGKHFSFLVFAGAQVLMDIEPLVRILRGDVFLHGYTHTIAGALLIGIISALIGKPIGAFALTVLRIPHAPLTWTAAFSGAMVGTLSHVALDAVMHADMQPWWPVASGNALLGLIRVEHLHVACAVLGALGLLVVAARALHRSRG